MSFLFRILFEKCRALRLHLFCPTAFHHRPSWMQMAKSGLSGQRVRILVDWIYEGYWLLIVEIVLIHCFQFIFVEFSHILFFLLLGLSRISQGTEEMLRLSQQQEMTIRILLCQMLTIEVTKYHSSALSVILIAPWILVCSGNGVRESKRQN